MGTVEPARAGRRIVSVAWALAPLELGIPAMPCFVIAAWRRRTFALWAEAAVYGVATVVFFSLANAPDGSAAQDVGGLLGAALMLVATGRALAIRRRVFGLVTIDRAGGPAVPRANTSPVTWQAPPDRTLDVPYDPAQPATWRTPFTCTGYDAHVVSGLTARFVVIGVAGVGLLVTAVLVHAPSRAFGVAGGMALVPLLLVLFSQRLDGPVLRYRMWGVSRELRLDEVTAVATAKRAPLALRLSAPGRRPVSVSLNAGATAVAVDVRDHLRGWLDRPGVALTPAAADLLRGTTATVARRASGRRRAVVLVATFALPLLALGIAVFVLHDRPTRVAIPGAAGYRTFGGPHGRALAPGRPWGRVCQPVRLAVDAAVPDAVYADVQRVVDEARRGGIDITVETRGFRWTPADLYFPPGATPVEVPRVAVFVDGMSHRLSNGRLEAIRLGWDADLDADHHHEHLTYADGVVHAPALAADPLAARRSVRQLIALTQGVIDTTASDSGIRSGSSIDRFTASDLAAMKAMSGCGDSAAPVVERAPSTR